MLSAIDFGKGVEDAWANVASFVPKFIAFLLILVIGYFICKAIGKIIDKVLERVGFDRAVEKGGLKKALESSKFDPSDIVGKLVFYALFLLVLQAAFGVFGTNPVSDLLTSVIAFLPKVIAGVIILVVAFAIAAAVKELVQASIGGLSYGKTLANLAGGVIVAVGFFAALNQIQIAPQIVTGLFYAALALIVGVGVVAIGGSGISVLGPYWQRSLSRMEDESSTMKRASQGTGDRVKQRAQDLKSTAQDSTRS